MWLVSIIMQVHYYPLLVAVLSKVSVKKKKKKRVEQRNELTRFQEGMKENRDSWQFQKFVSIEKTTASQP